MKTIMLKKSPVVVQLEEYLGESTSLRLSDLLQHQDNPDWLMLGIAGYLGRKPDDYGEVLKQRIFINGHRAGKYIGEATFLHLCVLSHQYAKQNPTFNEIVAVRVDYYDAGVVHYHVTIGRYEPQGNGAKVIVTPFSDTDTETFFEFSW